jgi:hypothetical protein
MPYGSLGQQHGQWFYVKSLKILLIVALSVAVILAVGVGILYAVRPTPDLGGQPDKFTIGTAVIVVGYLLFPILAVLVPVLLLISLLLLIANAVERRRPSPRP